MFEDDLPIIRNSHPLPTGMCFTIGRMMNAEMNCCRDIINV